MAIFNPEMTPDGYSAQDDIWVMAESTAAALNDMRYVVDVIDANISGQTLARLKVYPNPTNQHLYVNIKRLVQQLFKYPEFAIINGYYWIMSDTLYSSGNPYFAAYIDVQIGEEINGVATLNQESFQRLYFNFRPDHLKRYVDINSVLKLSRPCFLTTRPRKCKAYKNDFIALPFWALTDYNGGAYVLEIEFYQNNSMVYTDGSYVSANPIMQVDISPKNMEQVFGWTDYDRYRVRIYDNDIATWSEYFNVEIECERQYEAVNLVFINRYGVYDTARFSLVNKSMVDIERKSYWKNEVQFAPYLSSPSVQYQKSVSNFYPENLIIHNESKINFHQILDTNYKLIMDYPTDEEYEWLIDLIASPKVYMSFSGEKIFYPVTIKNTNYEYVKYHYAGLKTLELDIEFNQRRFAHTR